MKYKLLATGIFAVTLAALAYRIKIVEPEMILGLLTVGLACLGCYELFRINEIMF